MPKSLFLSFHSKFPNPEFAGSTLELNPEERKLWTFGRGAFCDFRFKRNGVSLYWSRLQATLVYVDEVSEWMLFRGGTIPAKYTEDKKDSPSLPTGEVYFNAAQLAHNERVILGAQDCVSMTPGDGVTADFYEARVMVAESLHGTVLPEVWEGEKWPGGKAKPKPAKELPKEVKAVVSQHLEAEAIDTPIEAGAMVWKDSRDILLNAPMGRVVALFALFSIVGGIGLMFMLAWKWDGQININRDEPQSQIEAPLGAAKPGEVSR